MRKTEEIRSILVRHKEEFEKKYGVTIIGVFGSHTRGEQTPASDLDVFVEVKSPLVSNSSNSGTNLKNSSV